VLCFVDSFQHQGMLLFFHFAFGKLLQFNGKWAIFANFSGLAGKEEKIHPEFVEIYKDIIASAKKSICWKVESKRG
jgi:hypothetical protein